MIGLRVLSHILITSSVSMPFFRLGSQQRNSLTETKPLREKNWHGLTKEAKERLEGFLDEDYPLNKFIDKVFVEHERQLLIEVHTPMVHHIPNNKKSSNPYPEDLQARGTLTLQNNQTPNQEGELNNLREQERSLTENFHKLQTVPPQPTPLLPLLPTPAYAPLPRMASQPLPRPIIYCPCCRSNRHNLLDCSSKPKGGACFDYHRRGCRLGNQDCPGKVNTNSS